MIIVKTGRKIWPADSIRIEKGRERERKRNGGRAEKEGEKGREAAVPHPNLAINRCN